MDGACCIFFCKTLVSAYDNPWLKLQLNGEADSADPNNLKIRARPSDLKLWKVYYKE